MIIISLFIIEYYHHHFYTYMLLDFFRFFSCDCWEPQKKPAMKEGMSQQKLAIFQSAGPSFLCLSEFGAAKVVGRDTHYH